MGKYKRLGRNMIIQGIGKFSSKILVFLLVPLYTSVMTREEYGIADYVSVTVQLLYPIITLIIVEAEVRFTLDPKEDKKSIFTFSNLIGLISLVAVLIFSPLLRKLQVLDAVFWYFYLQLAVFVFYEIFVHFAIGLDRFTTTATAGVLCTFGNAVATVLALLVFHTGVKGFLIGNSVGYFVGGAYIFYKERLYRYYSKQINERKDLIKQMLIYSIPMIPNSVSWWVNNSANKYMLEYYHGVAALALLAVAYKLPNVLVTISSLFVSAWRVSSVEHFGTMENQLFFKKIYKLFNLIVCLSTSLLLIFTQEISSVLFKTDFFIAWKIVPVLLIGFIFQVESSFLGSVFTANKKTKVLFISTMGGALINLLLNFFFIPAFGGIGAAFATLTGYFAICCIRYFYALKLVSLDFRIQEEVFSVVVLICLSFISYNQLTTRLLAGVLCVLLLLVLQKKSVMFLCSRLVEYTKRMMAGNNG